MTIGERIKQKRIELNMSQEELAHKCGYKSRSSINKIELSRDLPLNKISNVANALGVSPSYLMGWEDMTDAQNQFMRKKQEILEMAKIEAKADDKMKETIKKFMALPKDEQEHIAFMIDKLSKK